MSRTAGRIFPAEAVNYYRNNRQTLWPFYRQRKVCFHLRKCFETEFLLELNGKVKEEVYVNHAIDSVIPPKMLIVIYSCGTFVRQI